ncbi:MAG: tetratricopeptide repeat protein [Calditrichaeota bacterium]|nr:MAG: tetratricopeptide repeat protein [Calditrichota bacterium]
MDLTKIQTLEATLAQTKKHQEADRGVQAEVQAYLVSSAGPEPADGEVRNYFLTKHYPDFDIDLQPSSSEPYGYNELETMFFEGTQKALFLKFSKKPDEAQQLLDTTRKIAESLATPFLHEYLTFIEKPTTDVTKKLKLEYLYEQVNKTLAQNRITEGVQIIGTGLALAQQMGDQKRELDFYSKFQYVLYECLNCPNVALSLGFFLFSRVSGYDRLRCWTHFHSGNACLDLKDFPAAKKHFETALDLAIQARYAYASMVMHERLALTYKNLDKINLAEQHYNESLTLGQSENIKPKLVLQNKVRCLMGMGLLKYEKACGTAVKPKEKQRLCQDAEKLYKEARELAREIQYAANEAAALSNLGDLYRLWYGQTNPEAKVFHKLAHEIYTKQMGLDEKVERVKWDHDHMK